MALVYFLFICVALCNAQGQNVPAIPLYNAADPSLRMPVVGLGTGGYAAAKSSSAHPEHWNVSEGFINTLKWFSLNGVRWDTSNTYESVPGVAAGLLNATNNWTTTPRESVFITTKTGPTKLLGYNDTLNQVYATLKLFNTTYMDLVLIHWPSWNSSSSYQSSDPYCNAQPSNKQYSASKCRQSTWKALELLFDNKQAKAIGVSNYESKHLQDIFDLNSLLPAVNQFEFHGYWHEYELVEFCQSYNITVNSYAPLGTPDVTYGYWNPVLTEHPTAISIGNKYYKSAAQTWLRWQFQQGLVMNPRSWNISHMQQNMEIFDFELTQEDMLELGSITPPTGKDPKVCSDPEYWDR